MPKALQLLIAQWLGISGSVCWLVWACAKYHHCRVCANEARAVKEEEGTKRYGTVIAVVFPLTVLAAWAEQQHRICRYIMWPGAAIVLGWIDCWQQPLACLCLAIAFNTLLYSGQLWLFVKLFALGPSRKWRRNA
jgi:hypothetical protein